MSKRGGGEVRKRVQRGMSERYEKRECVWVCVRERERKREEESDSIEKVGSKEELAMEG